MALSKLLSTIFSNQGDFEITLVFWIVRAQERIVLKTFQSSIEKATVFCTEFIRRFLFKR